MNDHTDRGVAMETYTTIAYRRYRPVTDTHRHDFAQAIIPLRGLMEIEVDGSLKRLTHETAGIVTAESQHDFATSRDSEFLVLDLSAQLIRARFDGLPRLFTVHTSNVLRQYARFLAAATTSNPDGILPQSVSAATTALELLEEATTAVDQPVIPAYLSFAKRQLETDITTPNLVSVLLTQLNMSSSFFHRQFRAAFQKTPKQVQLEARLQAAIERLQNSNDTVTEIARQLGYENTSSLTYLFKKHLGATPSFYRN